MLISERPEKERKKILHIARKNAARYTEEKWDWIECGSLPEVKNCLSGGPRIDIFCMDITIHGMLEITKEIRAANPNGYIILVSDANISPVSYMRPTIAAESLMIKPLSDDQVEETLEEAIRTYAERFLKPKNENVFVLEYHGERRLMEYERIDYFEARERKVFLCSGNEEYGFYDTLEILSERMSEYFLRVHRSFLVNKKKIKKVYLSQNRLLLSGELEIPISRTYKPNVKQYLKTQE